MNYHQQQFQKNVYQNEVKEQQTIEQDSQHCVSTLTFKIKDSLYLGTSIEAFKDQQFILLNWVENVIVLETHEDKFDHTLKQLYGQENITENASLQECIKYLHCDTSLFNEKRKTKQKQMNIQGQVKKKQFTQSLEEIFNFIQSAEQKGTSCMILAVSAFPKISTTGYIFAICTAYMMKRYKWSLYKSLEYMNFKHPNASISEESLNFLNRLEIQLMNHQTITYNWKCWMNNDELILRNTFLNGKQLKWSETSITENTNQTIIIRKIESNASKVISNSPLKQTQQKSILKDSITRNMQSLPKRQKPRATINQQINTIILFNLNSQVTDTDISKQLSQSSQRLTLKKTNDSSTSRNQIAETFQTARNQRISLSVKKIVAKYRDQKNSSTSVANGKKISIDNSSEISGKGLNKKKSFYNFQPCQKINQKRQSNQIQSDGILKIVKKLKTQTDLSTSLKLEQQKIPTLPNENSQSLKSSYQENIKSLTVSLTQKPIKQLKDQNSWLQIINKKRLSNEMSLRKMRNLGSGSKKKDNKENESDMKNEQKDTNNRVYIKEVKKSLNDEFNDRKSSTHERIVSQQSLKKKDRNLIIEYEQFKQMIRKKQKSIGNLVMQNIQNANKEQKHEQKDKKISSVIEKLKKQSLQNPLSTTTSKLNFNEIKGSNKFLNSKSVFIQWR